MAAASQYLVILSFLFFLMLQSSQGGNTVKTAVFLSPKFEVLPGEASNKVFRNVGFPKGHIAIKSFDAEVVDEKGNSVPLYEAYLHHWIVLRYRQQIGNESTLVTIPNSGVCGDGSGLVQYFGLGSETRKTLTSIPDPYGIEVGNPAGVPQGYEEGWLINVHAIDTRGAVDRRGCLECTCSLYSNISMTGPLPSGYDGGLRCCTDGARCRVNAGYPNVTRSLYLKYTVRYVDWAASVVVPVRVYIFDITDLVALGNKTAGIKTQHNCQVEHDVEACPSGNRGCIDSRTLSFDFEQGGDVIYGVGHLHVGGRSIALYGEGGKEICTSYTKYGTGRRPGNEAGYVVGMSTCYPRPGSVKIASGEMITMVSNYSSTVRHTGVMGLFYLLVADSSA